jgi:hypothetical protein
MLPVLPQCDVHSLEAQGPPLKLEVKVCITYSRVRTVRIVGATQRNSHSIECNLFRAPMGFGELTQHDVLARPAPATYVRADVHQMIRWPHLHPRSDRHRTKHWKVSQVKAMSATTNVNITAFSAGRASTLKVRFAVDETFEFRKEALDAQRRKERKEAKVCCIALSRVLHFARWTINFT